MPEELAYRRVYVADTLARVPPAIATVWETPRAQPRASLSVNDLLHPAKIGVGGAIVGGRDTGMQQRREGDERRGERSCAFVSQGSQVLPHFVRQVL